MGRWGNQTWTQATGRRRNRAARGNGDGYGGYADAGHAAGKGKGKGKGKGSGTGHWSNNPWDIPRGYKIACLNPDCDRVDEYADTAKHCCPKCKGPYKWGEWWEAFSKDDDAAPEDDDPTTEPAKPTAPGDGGDAPAAARIDSSNRWDKAKHAKAETRSKPTDPGKLAYDAWRKSEIAVEKERADFTAMDARLVSLVDKVKEQIEKMSSKRESVKKAVQDHGAAKKLYMERIDGCDEARRTQLDTCAGRLDASITIVASTQTSAAAMAKAAREEETKAKQLAEEATKRQRDAEEKARAKETKKKQLEKLAKEIEDLDNEDADDAATAGPPAKATSVLVRPGSGKGSKSKPVADHNCSTNRASVLESPVMGLPAPSKPASGSKDAADEDELEQDLAAQQRLMEGGADSEDSDMGEPDKEETQEDGVVMDITSWQAATADWTFFAEKNQEPPVDLINWCVCYENGEEDRNALGNLLRAARDKYHEARKNAISDDAVVKATAQAGDASSAAAMRTASDLYNQKAFADIWTQLQAHLGKGVAGILEKRQAAFQKDACQQPVEMRYKAQLSNRPKPTKTAKRRVGQPGGSKFDKIKRQTASFAADVKAEKQKLHAAATDNTVEVL
jgi:hypothetical protein